MKERRRRKTMAKHEDTLVKYAYQDFVNEKKAMNLSSATLATYDLHISNFINTMDLAEFRCGLLSVGDGSMYFDWIEYLQEDENKKDVTVASYCRSVRAFLYWLQDNDYCEPLQYKIPKYQKTIKVCYTDEELALLLAKPQKNCSEVEYQTWVFINLICSTGMRLSSALNLKVADLNKSEKSVYIQETKNNKAQVLYLNDNMFSILKKYVTLFELEKDDWLFCTAEHTQLAKRTIQDNVATYNRKLNVQKTSIHLMRHTFAKNYYIETKDVYNLCQILGHSNISVTENYLGLSAENSTAYNPQKKFVQKKEKKRRGRLKL